MTIRRRGVDVPDDATEKAELSRVMAKLGRKGGRIGGKRRLTTLSAERRSAIARKAALQRWKKL